MSPLPLWSRQYIKLLRFQNTSYTSYKTRDVITYPLFLIFNKSLETGKLPGDWKLAEVTATYKKGSRHDRSNYRPVSLTSVCCKILESLIRDRASGSVTLASGALQIGLLLWSPYAIGQTIIFSSCFFLLYGRPM